MVSRHQSVFDSVFKIPVQASIIWSDVENMLRYLGADIEEREGSRVCVALGGRKLVAHKPHKKGRKEADKGAVKAVRKFLEAVGYTRSSLI